MRSCLLSSGSWSRICTSILYVSIHKRYNDGAVLTRRLCPTQNFLSVAVDAGGSSSAGISFASSFMSQSAFLCSTSARVADSGRIKASRARRAHDYTNPTLVNVLSFIPARFAHWGLRYVTTSWTSSLLIQPDCRWIIHATHTCIVSVPGVAFKS